MKLLIVESPAKAKVLGKYLGKDFRVEASYGHICDLPSKNGSVLPEEDFLMKYEISGKASYVDKLCNAAKTADEIFLATDPDREGEAISWHVVNVLREREVISEKVPIHRVVFHEITKKAVLSAIQSPRKIDNHLVDAQQARRALDYLVGFNVSPVLWRKLPGSRSAGRVQSVALRLICEREEEIERFKTEEYWDIIGNFNADPKQKKQSAFNAKMIIANHKKLEKFSMVNEEQVTAVKDACLLEKEFSVLNIEKKTQKRNPSAPFTTSTLQQEAARKLNYSVKKTMQLAQKLYEGINIDGETVGLITYMRTDSINISEDAIISIREYIKNNYDKEYLASQSRTYKNKAKNAQEAHEAIRPTNISYAPNAIKSQLDADMWKLYELVWKRTVASQMSSAELELVAIDIGSHASKFVFRANGSILRFDGFYVLYREGSDDLTSDEEDDENKILPPMNVGDAVSLLSLLPKQHFTQPPPRFSEASLVKKLEELGIGRPSTYASIISVIQDRSYVKLEKKRFVLEEKGRLVTVFLVKFFSQYVQYDFTASLEEELDKIADGEMNWKVMLRGFWTGFHEKVEEVLQLRTSEVIDYLDDILSDHLFPHTDDSDPRKCKSCETGRLGLRLGRYGAFIACSNYPDCSYRRSVDEMSEAEAGHGTDSDAVKQLQDDERLLGEINGVPIVVKKGPYGFYIQENDPALVGKKGVKPKRASIPKGYDPLNVDLELATNILSLPKILGKHPETQEEISVAIGKYGPYIKCGNKFTPIPKNEDLFRIDCEKSVQLISKNVKTKVES